MQSKYLVVSNNKMEKSSYAKMLLVGGAFVLGYILQSWVFFSFGLLVAIDTLSLKYLTVLKDNAKYLQIFRIIEFIALFIILPKLLTF